MSGDILHYFAGGNTARGFYSLFENSLQDLEKVFILKGGPGTGKSTLMKNIGLRCNERGLDIEYIHCSSDPDSLDGVIMRGIGVGIVDGTAPHIIEPKVPGAVEEYVNLGAAWDSSKLESMKSSIIDYNHHISAAYQNAYKSFAKALKIHDRWEKIYIQNMDFIKANELTESLIHRILGTTTFSKEANVKHRFLGAATPRGAVDFVQNLTENVERRLFIKGRPGSGKSTMLKKLAASAESRGVDVEVYHCGFDPESIDMVILREIGVSIFDSTAPHEYFPSRDGDEIIELYGEIIDGSTDEVYGERIEECSQQYKEMMKTATGFLAEAKENHDQLEKIYIQAMDFTRIDALGEEILEKIAKRIH